MHTIGFNFSTSNDRPCRNFTGATHVGLVLFLPALLRSEQLAGVIVLHDCATCDALHDVYVCCYVAFHMHHMHRSSSIIVHLDLTCFVRLTYVFAMIHYQFWGVSRLSTSCTLRVVCSWCQGFYSFRLPDMISFYSRLWDAVYMHLVYAT